jgi:hypothetical protein
MLLQDLHLGALPYLERYVNNGSPSGFTTRYTTSPDTSPFSLKPFIHPYVCAAQDQSFINFGRLPNFEGLSELRGKNWLLIHPDMKDEKIFHGKNVSLIPSTEIGLIPTASGRTLELISSLNRGYFKLHYDGIIGRIPRELNFKKAVAGPEISKLLVSLIDQNKLDSRLKLMRETGARVFLGTTRGKRKIEWGMVWREKDPYNVDFNKVKYIIPVFSLFATDRLAKKDKPLLEQIIKLKGVPPVGYVLEQLIFPMIDCYFNLIQQSGIQPEWHAQNLLVGFTEDFTPVNFIMRDLESMDKDLTFMQMLNLKVEFQSYPFKCIWKDQWNYKIKHSFMYDYKFGEYILQPLLNFLKKSFEIETSCLNLDIKHYSKTLINEFPKDFFPKDWYVFKKVLIDQSTDSRPYVKKRNPKFRF